MSKPIIALDMDGVIADWSAFINDKLPEYGLKDVYELNKAPNRNEIIDDIYRLNKYAFERLPFIERSSRLLDYLDSGVKLGYIDLVIATHTVKGMQNIRHEGVRQQKINWLNVHVKPRWPNLIKYDGQVMAFTGEGIDTKAMIANDNVLLIDDYHRNITEFSERGGHGILVKEASYRADFVIDQIEKFLIKQNKA